MNISFLQSLPAILAVLVYVIYLLVKKSTIHDPVVKSIIDKLKYNDPNYYQLFKQLNDKQKEQKLRSDDKFREHISERDRTLLDKALGNQFKTNIFVYSLCAVLLLAGIGLYVYQMPKPLEIDNISIQNTDSSSNSMIVDLDAITVTWTTKGKDEGVKVVLENAQTGQQTSPLNVQASEGKIKFLPNAYTNFDKIFRRDRIPNEVSRIRAIIYGSKESFNSKEFEIRAGVTIIGYGKKPNKLIFNAILDQTIIDNFNFSPSLALFKGPGFKNRIIFEAPGYAAQPTLIVSNLKNVNFSQLVFSVNPRDVIDQRIYRVDIQSIREALSDLKASSQ